MANSVTCLVCDKTSPSVWPVSAHPTPSLLQPGLTQQQLHASSGAVYAITSPNPQSFSTVGSLLDPQIPLSALRYSAIRSDEALRLGASSDPRYSNVQRSSHSHSHQVRRKSHSQLVENDSSPPIVPLSYKLCSCAPTAASTTTVVALQAQQQQQQFFERQQQQLMMSASGGRGNERQLQTHQAHSGSPSLTFASGASSARQSSRQQQQRELSASRGSDVPSSTSAQHPQAQLHASHNQSRLAYQT